MADGEEDLREKNRGFGKPGSKSRFTKWERRLGEEDAGMLEEKSEHWSARNSNRGDYDSEDE